MSYRIFVINPGSTSTKLAYFEDDTKICEENVFHDAPELAKFGSVSNQFAYRKQMILDFLAENGIDLSKTDAIVGRGGASASVNSGTYEVNDKLLQDISDQVTKVDHPANLAVPLAAELAAEYGCRAFMVDSPKVDELIDEARITGMDGLYRGSSLHVLNLKGTARLHCGRHGSAACAAGCRILRKRRRIQRYPDRRRMYKIGGLCEPLRNIQLGQSA